MRRNLLILSVFASLALPAQSTEKATSATAPVGPAALGTVVCRGVQDVPVTADAEQALPLRLVAKLGCGEQVAVLSDSEGYTANIRTADGKIGYVARMYLSEAPAISANDHRAVEAEVHNGIARWQSGAPGTSHFFSRGSLVESLTANGITVQISLQDTGWKLRATVAIANDGSEATHVNPARFTLDELMPRLRTLPVQNPRELAKAVTHQVYWTNASAIAPASAVYTNAAYKISTHAGSTPNYLAQEPEQVQSNVLQEASIAPKEKASGVVWFERDKNAQELNLRIFVGDQIFEFPLSFPPHN